MDKAPDLNDLYYFAAVVEHGGFASAGRALGIPKSKLSRRIAVMEERLGVRLVHRSTRKFVVTEVGHTFHQHCAAVLAEAQVAMDMIGNAQAEPQGNIRIACPVPLAQVVMPFLKRYPRVTMYMRAINRQVDLIEERLDLALRVDEPPAEDGEMIIRTFGQIGQALVASPELLDSQGRPSEPAELERYPTVSKPQGRHYAWTLRNSQGRTSTVAHDPRLVSAEIGPLHQAALDGVGVALLPKLILGHDLDAKRLEIVLPDWTPPAATVHAVFPSRRGLPPAVRALIDLLADAFSRDGIRSYDELQNRTPPLGGKARAPA